MESSWLELIVCVCICVCICILRLRLVSSQLAHVSTPPPPAHGDDAPPALLRHAPMAWNSSYPACGGPPANRWRALLKYSTATIIRIGDGWQYEGAVVTCFLSACLCPCMCGLLLLPLPLPRLLSPWPGRPRRASSPRTPTTATTPNNQSPSHILLASAPSQPAIQCKAKQSKAKQKPAIFLCDASSPSPREHVTSSSMAGPNAGAAV